MDRFIFKAEVTESEKNTTTAKRGRDKFEENSNEDVEAKISRTIDSTEIVNQQESSKKIHPFFTQCTNKTTVDWQERKNLLIGTVSEPPACVKVAAFDLDGTLITTKSSKKFSEGPEDWKWWSPGVPKKLKQLLEEGYKVIIITNQGGIKDKGEMDLWKKKIEYILSALGIPIQLIAAIEKDRYRKPMTGIWEWFVEEGNQQVAVNSQQSFYVGDAAGRPAGWKKHAKADFSCVDRKLAANIGINFYTPEEFFLNESPVAFTWGKESTKETFDPKSYPKDLPLFIPTEKPLLLPLKHEIVVCCGFPASGKSRFVMKWLVSAGYAYVNQDTLKSKKNCITECERAVKEGKSVVVDNTNPDPNTRAEYIRIAKAHKISVRCFYFNVPEGLARHNNWYRVCYNAFDVGQQKGRELLPDIAFSTFKARFITPTTTEGFEEVKTINFVFEGSEEERARWEKWHR